MSFPARALNCTAPFNPAAATRYGLMLPPRTPQPPRRVSGPFRAADHRPPKADGVFRVVLVAAGDGPVPETVAALSKDPGIALQVLGGVEQGAVDAAVRGAWGVEGPEWGVRVWRDDEGEGVLHRELRRWADAVLVAPCSADMLAKIAAGMSETVALSLLRALPASTPVIVCPAMDADMYRNVHTERHLRILRDELHFVVLEQPEGDKDGENVGAMADWRDIVIAVQDMAALFHMRQQQRALGKDMEVDGDSGSDSAPTKWKPPHVELGPPPPGAEQWAADRDKDGIPLPFWVFRPIWGEATQLPRDPSHSFMQPVPGLPSQRTEYDRIAESSPPSSTPIDHRPKAMSADAAWRAMSHGMYWEQKWWC